MKLLEHINTISVGLGILIFGTVIIKNLVTKQQNKLEDILVKVFAGSAIPTGILLLFCAFKPALISHLKNLNIHIAVAGLALIYISCSSLFSKNKSE